MLKVENLHKSFGALNVLSGITTQVDQGEVVAILGPSGSGKSTFLRCLNLLEQPTSGNIYFKDVRINDPKCNILKTRENIVMVFQHFNLFPHMTVLQNITYAPMKVKGLSKEQARSIGIDLLRKVDLAEKADVYPSRLSGGQKQRVAIARAILRDAAVLLLDEATSALDAESERDVQAAVEALSKGRTTLVVAHRLATVKRADRIFVFDQGRIVATGTHDALVAEGGLYARLARLQFTDGQM